MVKDLLISRDAEAQIIKENLAYAYQILSQLRLDDHTYTHLSARSARGFFIYPFGLLFAEVTPDNLLEVTLDGEILIGREYQYNKTGYIIHGEIYKKRPDINAVFHLHTPEIVAVSAHQYGLMPISQWALHFYNKIAYHNYDSLALNSQQGASIAADLQDYSVMLMRNHGSITCGKTIHEALFYTYHLQQACKTQCLVQDASAVLMPSGEVACAAVADLLSFETDLGQRDWQAWLRRIGVVALSDASVLDELKVTAAILDCPAQFGVSKAEVVAQLCDAFWAIDAVGNSYDKQEFIAALFDHEHNSNANEGWEASDFQLTKIAADNYLLKYVLRQAQAGASRRVTLWRRVHSKWHAIYHQVTGTAGL